MKKIIFLLLFTLLLLVSLNGCESRASREERMRVERQAYFATQMLFSMNVETRSPTRYINTLFYPHLNPTDKTYTDIAFVHAPEEATGFPENVLVVWPSEGVMLDNGMAAWGTLGQIAYYVGNIKLDNPDVDFRDYGLPENEITLFDVVENWEIVYEIFVRYQSALRGFGQWLQNS